MPHPKNITPDEDEALILDSIDQFLERDVKPVAHDLEAADEYPSEIADKMAELGLYGATISPEYGGLGLSAGTYVKIVERMSAVWMSVSGLFNAHLIMAQTVERAGTEEQKQKWLPRFASGELFGGIALTEPDCGTDLQGIRTKATLDGNDYVIDGNKMWITNGPDADTMVIYAKTDAEAGAHGITAHLREDPRTDPSGHVPLRRLGQPEDIAGTVVYAASRASAYMTGAQITIDGGLTGCA